MQFTLKDGSPVNIRPIGPDAERTLIEGFKRLSPESVYQRFLSPMRELRPNVAHHLANVDHVKRLALIAEAPVIGDADLVGIARYEPTDDPALVEIALVVGDDWQGRGLGRLLLRSIMCAAAEKGFHRFRADVLGENYPMLHLLATECDIYARSIERGVITLSFTPRNVSVGGPKTRTG